MFLGFVAGLVFSGATGALARAEKTNAQNTAYNLKTSISAYYTEYRKYPVGQDRKEGEELRSNHEIMDVLLGSDTAAKEGGLNTRKIVFFTGRAARPMENGEYRKGVKLDSKGGGGELWDPWGNHYFIRLDLDYNDKIDKPKWDKEIDAEDLPKSILIWSAGKDGIPGTKDDIKTR